MVTLIEVKNIISEQRDVVENSDGPRRSRAKNKLQLYLVIEAYLQTTPSEDFVRKELKRVENRLRLINEGFVANPEWEPKRKSAELKQYSRLMNVGQLRDQRRALRIIIK